MECIFCKSKNTIVQNKNSPYLKEHSMCLYCYAVQTYSFLDQANNKLNDNFINQIGAFSKTLIQQNNYKHILIFDNGSSLEENIHLTDVKFNLINNFENQDLSQYLKYGRFDMLIVSDLNMIRLDNFLNTVSDFLSKNASIVLGFFRKKYYLENKIHDYKFIYNCFCIDQISKKHNLYVDSNFIYENNYYTINLTRQEPSILEIDNLEKLTNQHIIEDNKQ